MQLTLMTPRLEQAIRIAATAHRNQKRKGSDTPYVVHPFSVMYIASGATDDEDTLIACLFHDIIEDVPEEYPEAKMRTEFGERVVEIVLGVTKDDTIEDWHERSQAYLDNLRDNASDESVIVSASDKIHNLMSTLADYDRVGDEIWQVFSTKDAKDQLWWYESILEVLKERKTNPVLIEKLDMLVSELGTKV
jgi:(p)ppGpp synthase/HD superfamily hydrolase